MRRLGALVMTGGVALWIAGTIAWMSGVWVTLPPDEARVLVLSLVGVSGGSLVVGGALIGRSRRSDSRSPVGSRRHD